MSIYPAVEHNYDEMSNSEQTSDSSDQNMSHLALNVLFEESRSLFLPSMKRQWSNEKTHILFSEWTQTLNSATKASKALITHRTRHRQWNILRNSRRNSFSRTVNTNSAKRNRTFPIWSILFLSIMFHALFSTSVFVLRQKTFFGLMHILHLSLSNFFLSTKSTSFFQLTF